MPTHPFTGKGSFHAKLLSSHSSRVGFEIEKVLSRATTVQPEHKALASSGCLYCVGDAEAKVEVFERNPEPWQHPQEREECV